MQRFYATLHHPGLQTQKPPANAFARKPAVSDRGGSLTSDTQDPQTGRHVKPIGHLRPILGDTLYYRFILETYFR